jgi:BolA family transcriptional regulator, general stress-responsive regulator
MSTGRVERLRQALEAGLHPALLEIRDDSAKHIGHAGAREGGHFHVTIAAAAFDGLSQVQRHRMVYAAAAELMGTDIHALSIDAREVHPPTR